jgi:glutamine amidotransferase
VDQPITIVDYEAGNLTSVRLALERLGRRGVITGDPDAVLRAERVVFPGVGAAPHVMERLRTSGLGAALREYAATGRPLLGICIGAQVALGHSEEGDVDCLGLIEGKVARLDVPPEAKIPHMGWNGVRCLRPHPLFEAIEDGSQFYFVHSYFPVPADGKVALGVTDYWGDFTSAMAQANVVATQFHPERSGRVGLRLLANFLAWDP